MSIATLGAGSSETIPQAKLGMISGYTDYNLSEHQAFYEMRKKVQECYERHGFAAFIPRPVERMENLTLKGGIQKQIYRLALRDGTPTEIGMPFDRTVPLAIFIAEHCSKITFPFKRFDISYSFRGEHAQPGRFRGFYQADVDIIGRNLQLQADVECISTIYDALTSLEIGAFTISLNNIKLVKKLLILFGVSEDKVPETLRIIDKMDKLEKEEIIKELQELLTEMNPEKIEQIVDLYAFSGSFEAFRRKLASVDHETLTKCDPFIKELEALTLNLAASGVNMEQITFSPKMVRGLDYYTGIVFETFLVGKEKFGSIASGGRYDQLVDVYLDKETGYEGTGGAIGLTRLFDIALREDLIVPNRQTISQVLITQRTDEFGEQANRIGHLLRKHGVNVDIYVGTKRIKKELEYANKKGFPFTIMIMDHNSYVVRNLETSQQIDLPTLEEAVSKFLELLNE